MRLLALAALICLVANPVLPSMAQDDALPNLTGLWKINEAKSDDLSATMRQAMSGGKGRGGGPGGGGGGRGMGGGQRGGGGGGSPQDSEEAQKRLEELQLQYASLEIFQDGVELNVTNGLNITQLLYTDGRQMTIWTQHGEADATAVWQDQTLVMTWKTRQDAPQRVRQYEISEDGLTLTATEERQLPGQDKPTRIKLVYDLQQR